MAIKIGGTEVINDSLKLKNITDATGFFTGFHANPATVTDNINFTTPMNTCTLAAATTFTESGMAAGKSAILLLDTSTNYYTPTFPSSWNWPNNTEPTWGDYQHWQVYATCVSASEIRANAVGFTATSGGPQTETVSLEGTTSTPITFQDMSAGIDDLVMGWTFDLNGNIYKYENVYNVGGNGTYLYSTSTWLNVTPGQTEYWIRVTNYSGNNLSTTDSDPLNSWISLSTFPTSYTTRTFRYRDSRDITTYGNERGTMKVEIASDSGGSNILATGYYECEWDGTA